MKEAISTYILSIACGAMVVAILTSFLHSKALKRVLALCCGLLMVLLICGPLLRMNFSAFGSYLSELQIQADEIQSGITINNTAIITSIIKEKTEAYILDKAEELGAEVTVNVQMNDDGAYPYPYSVTIGGGVTAYQKTKLTVYMAEELAIPKERQLWGG